MATDLWDDLASIVDAPDSFAIKGSDKGSVKAKADFNAGEDVVALRKAIEGLGTTDKTLIDILSHRSSSQREAICKAYLAATNRTLVDDLKGDTHGNFERLLVALATPPDVYDAQEVMRAMEGVGTEDSTLIEIFASRTNQQVKALAAAYLEETERKLTFDLKKEVSGQFGDALLLLAQGNRDESIAVDQNMVKEDAKALYDAGEKKLGTDEDKFIEILCKRSIPQLRQTFVEYKEISGRTLQKSIEREMSGTLEELLVAIVKCAKNVPAYFAERLQYSVKGVGTDEKTLTRIMVCRSELDMLDIRTEFKKLAEKSLHDAIESDVSGSFGDCLKMICGGED
ncbi:annexin A3a isoform X2 [Engraulis encrasicolus]|uniref:annexin A3a isoform X2 n=1 Tax=Engraulis encrasicolus TaxID=184585 RepID=UPI002FD3017A